MTFLTFLALTWRPLIWPPYLAVTGLALVALAGLACRRSMSLNRKVAITSLLMRSMAIGAMLVILLGPSNTQTPPPKKSSQKPQLTVALDLSSSMLTADAPDGTARIDYAARTWLNPEFRRKLAEQYSLRFTGLDAALRPLVDHEAQSLLKRTDGRQSLIADSLRALFLDMPERQAALGTAILLISDGHDSASASPALPGQMALRRGVPIHTVTLGGPSLVRDVTLTAYQSSDVLFPGETATLTVEIHQAGFDESGSIFRLTGPGKQIAQPVRFQGQSTLKLEFPFSFEKNGTYEYELAVDPIAGESAPENNRIAVYFEVNDRRLRILILEGEPFWETKFLAQSLRKDSRLEVVQISQVSQQKKSLMKSSEIKEEVKTPDSLETLARHDLIILGKGLEHVIDPAVAALLPVYVRERGGNVLFARGRAYDADTPAGRRMGGAISPLEPVVWEQGLTPNTPLKFTAEGIASGLLAPQFRDQSLEQVLAALPGFSLMHRAQSEKPGVTVLARAALAGAAADQPQQPAILLMPYGRGKVLTMMGDGIWRWRLLPETLKGYEGFYDLFWSSTVRFMTHSPDASAGQQITLQIGRAQLRLGDSLLIEARSNIEPPAGFAPSLSVIDPSGQSAPVAMEPANDSPRRWTATFKPVAPGPHRLTMNGEPLKPGVIEKRFSVFDLNMERLHASARPSFMSSLSQLSGGRTLDPANPEAFLEQLALDVALQSVPPRVDYIWDRFWLMFGLLVWAGIEWLVRRNAGLL